MSKKIRETLSSLSVYPRKSRGQNFLLNPSLCEKYVFDLHIDESDFVLEIGPGLGAITRYLVQRTNNFRAIEIEKSFCEYLCDEEKILEQSQIICGDVLEKKIEDLLPPGIPRCVLVSNVPYAISSPLLLWCIKHRERIKSAHFLLQREFAERVSAPCGGRERGSLSVLAQRISSVTRGSVVKGSSFYPQADVESRFISLDFSPNIQADPFSDIEFEHFIRGCFKAKRKMLLGNILTSQFVSEKSELLEIFSQCNISPSARAEQLSVEQFLCLAEKVLCKRSAQLS